MFKVSIVIPNYNKWTFVHQVLFDIYNHCSSVHEVLVVNDGCTEPESFTGLEWWMQNKMLPVRELRLEQNVNFLRASSTGLKESTGDIVILLSNDVRVLGDIVKEITSIIHKNPKSLVGGRLLSFDTGWNKFGNRVFPYLEGWLLATTKLGWNDLGLFDELYAPHDMEDVDITTTAYEKGYKVIPLSEEITKHIGAQSIGYGDERQKITEENKRKFESKWITKKVSP